MSKHIVWDYYRDHAGDYYELRPLSSEAYPIITAFSLEIPETEENSEQVDKLADLLNEIVEQQDA